jgi:hypothetical protein
MNGDRASFGGNAKSDETGATQGQEEYQDHGPAQRMNVKSIEVLAIVCEESPEPTSMDGMAPGQTATIYGRATVDGEGSFFYRIRVMDNGEPGRDDMYGIIVSNGYASGDNVLQGGNVQIRREDSPIVR